MRGPRPCTADGDERASLDRVARLGPELLPGCDAAEVVVIDSGLLVRIGASFEPFPAERREPPDAPLLRQAAPALTPAGMRSSAWLPIPSSDDFLAALLAHTAGPDILVSAGAERDSASARSGPSVFCAGSASTAT
jgi:hypothetical protein